MCPRRGELAPEPSRFCPACGAPVSTAPVARERREVVTVIFADVVGSTALGERVDPETLRWAMQRWFGRIRDAVERHGGTVENYIGDAVMAVFGVPAAHEDDALRAVRAAAEIREQGAVLRGDLRRERGLGPCGPHRGQHRGGRHGRRGGRRHLHRWRESFGRGAAVMDAEPSASSCRATPGARGVDDRGAAAGQLLPWQHRSRCSYSYAEWQPRPSLPLFVAAAMDDGGQRPTRPLSPSSPSPRRSLTPQDVGGSRADRSRGQRSARLAARASVAPRVPTPHVRPIVHRDRIAALAAERVYYASSRSSSPTLPSDASSPRCASTATPSTPAKRAAPATSRARRSALRGRSWSRATRSRRSPIDRTSNSQRCSERRSITSPCAAATVRPGSGQPPGVRVEQPRLRCQPREGRRLTATP